MRLRVIAIACAAILAVTGRAAPGPIPGDINADGVVDGEDLEILLTLWGHQGSGADLNGDGWVDFADLLILLTHWT